MMINEFASLPIAPSPQKDIEHAYNPNLYMINDYNLHSIIMQSIKYNDIKLIPIISFCKIKSLKSLKSL